MNYWIFTVTSHRDYNLTGGEIFNRRMQDRFWGLGERTPNRQNLSEDDKVVYYVGTPKKAFVGTVTLASPCFELNDSQMRQYGHGIEFYSENRYGVLLKDIEIWHVPKPAEELVPHLKFIENKQFWGAYLQGGVRQITEEDFRVIIGEISLVERIVTAKDLESPPEFALETHLEEFIYQNWGKINWGSKLELYETDEQKGRQFPAGTWSIDFLAIDKSTNDLVVIELKKGKTSYATVGQIQTYINWVKENVADDGQNVRGIIIAKKIDDRLKYAVKNLEYIELKEYKVDFQLSAFPK